MDFRSARLRVRRAGAGAAAALTVVALLAGCGTSVSPATQRAEIRGTLDTFMRELAAGDGTIACERLTSAGQASVIHTIGPELANFGIDTCAQVVHLTGTQLTPRLRGELAGVMVGAVAVHDSTATVRWSAITSPAGDVAAYFGRPKPVTLSNVDGVWRISAL